jgi:short-subunit dehydrogenase
MIKRGSGKIMNVASTAAFQPGPTMSVYFASKAYVLSFSEAVNNEVADRGVTVTALCPGSTESGFHDALFDNKKQLKKRKMSSSRSIAEYGYRVMMKGKPVAIPGLKNALMANMIRFIPRSLIVKAVKNIQSRKFEE